MAGRKIRQFPARQMGSILPRRFWQSKTSLKDLNNTSFSTFSKFHNFPKIFLKNLQEKRKNPARGCALFAVTSRLELENRPENRSCPKIAAQIIRFFTYPRRTEPQPTQKTTADHFGTAKHQNPQPKPDWRRDDPPETSPGAKIKIGTKIGALCAYPI